MVLHPKPSALSPTRLNHYHCLKPASSIKAVCLAMVIVDWKVTAAASVELVGLLTYVVGLFYLRTQLLRIERQEGSHEVPNKVAKPPRRAVRPCCVLYQCRGTRVGASVLSQRHKHVI
jgi:hypothetical protein